MSCVPDTQVRDQPTTNQPTTSRHDLSTEEHEEHPVLLCTTGHTTRTLSTIPHYGALYHINVGLARRSTVYAQFTN